LDKIIQLPFFLPPHSERIQALVKTLLDRIGELDPEERRELESITEIIGPACDNNPREVVRFVNKLLVAGEIAEGRIPVGFFAVTLSLQQRWKKFFGELSRSATLCSAIVEWEKDELAGKAKLPEDKEPTIEEEAKARAAKSLMEDENLAKLLFSPPGRKWLSDDQTRRSAIHHLITQTRSASMESEISLVHTSWRSPKHDAKFPGKKMYRFDAEIDAPKEILRRIEKVTYRLHASYPNPERVVFDEENRFKLKELAWAGSTLKAEVKFKNRQEPILLSRFISLEEKEPVI
jgi:hypothetical protein